MVWGWDWEEAVVVDLEEKDEVEDWRDGRAE